MVNCTSSSLISSVLNIVQMLNCCELIQYHFAKKQFTLKVTANTLGQCVNQDCHDRTPYFAWDLNGSVRDILGGCLQVHT